MVRRRRSGAPDLLTIRAATVLGQADIVVWARSLVDERILEHASPDAELIASDDRTHDELVAIYARAAANDLQVARVQSGDPSLYGTLHEQIEACRRLGLSYELVPGVSSIAAAAAALGQELTVPDVSQTLILTRRATRTTMPDNERLVELARHGTTLVLFLSVRRPRELQAELLEGGYAADCPVRGRLPGHLARRARDPLPAATSSRTQIREAKITTQALVIVGPALAQTGDRRASLARVRRRLRPPVPPARPPRPLPIAERRDDAICASPTSPPARAAWPPASCARAGRPGPARPRPRRPPACCCATARRPTRSRSRSPAASSGPASSSSAASPTATARPRVVVKDAGDDPDVTHGAHLTAARAAARAARNRAARRRRASAP